MNNKQIGLVVAGCKGGYRLLCSNGVVDTREEEISRTLSDIRSAIRINRNHLTLYALEFTSQYKVYSVYRSCNDNGSGAFVNIVVYVPHETRIDKIRELLDNMIEYYFKEYVNPLHGTYYPGTYDNINPFSDILQSAEIKEETRHFTHRRSKQDDTPGFYIYNDVSEVDGLFESPYRKEFFDCQEVMFMSRTIYESGLDSFSFNREANIITHLSEQEQMPVLCLDCQEVTRLLINDIDRDKNGQYSVNLSTDRLSVSVKYRYCREVKIQGLVSDLLDKGELKLDINTKTISLGYIVKEYLNYDVGFTVNGVSTPNGLVAIHSDKGMVEVSDSRVSLSGEWLENEWTILVQPLLGSQNKLVPVGKFKPKNYLKEKLDIKLQKFMFNVSVTGSVKGDVFVNVTGLKDPINVGRLKNNSGVTLYLPKEIDLKSTEFDPSSPEVELKFDWDSRVLSLICKVLEYQLELLPQVKEMLLNWDFKINNNSKKKLKLLGGEVVKISPDEDISSGKLLINGRLFDFTIDEDKILPCLVYIDDPDEVSYKYTAVGPDGNKIVEKTFPDGSARKIEATGADVNEETVDGFTVCKLCRNHLSEKCVNRTGSVKSEKSDIKVTFIGCDGLFYSKSESHDRKPCTQQSVSLKSKSEQITVYDKQKGGKRKCVVKYNGEYSKFEQKENAKNGFTVKHIKNTCTVEYKKSNKNLLIIFVAALAIALIGLTALLVSLLVKTDNSLESKVIMSIEVKLAENPDLGEKIDDIRIADNKIAGVTDKDGKYHIEVYWNQKAARNKYESLSKILIYLNPTFKLETKLFDDNNIQSRLTEINKDLVKSESFTPRKETFVVTSTFQNDYNVASQKDSLSVWKSLLEQYCKDNSLARDIILRKAKEIGGPTPTEDFLKQYLEEFKPYSESSSYKNVEGELNKRNESARVADLTLVAEKYIELLKSDNCDLPLVDEFKKWWDEGNFQQKDLGQYYWPCRNSRKAYNDFFNAKSHKDFGDIYNNENMKQTFSDKQQDVLYALSFNKNSHDNFNEHLIYKDMNGENVKGFKELINMNIQRKDVERTYKNK